MIIRSIIQIVKSLLKYRQKKDKNIIIQEKIAQFILNNHADMDSPDKMTKSLNFLNEDILDIEHNKNFSNHSILSLQMIKEQIDRSIFENRNSDNNNNENGSNHSILSLQMIKEQIDRSVFENRNSDNNNNENGSNHSILSLQMIKEKIDRSVFKNRNSQIDNDQQNDITRTRKTRVEKISGDKNIDEKQEPKIIVKKTKKNRIFPSETREPELFLNKFGECNETTRVSKNHDTNQPKDSKRNRSRSKTQKSQASERISGSGRNSLGNENRSVENNQSESRPGPINVNPTSIDNSRNVNLINNATNIE